MKLAGALTAAVSAVVFAAALAFAPYADFGNGSQKLWDFTTRWPVILTALAVVAVALSVTTLLARRALPAVLLAGVGFYVFGQVFDDGLASYSGYQFGFWLTTGASLAMAAGGMLAAVGAMRADSPLSMRGQSPYPVSVMSAAGSQVPSTAPMSPPAGWYPDPSGQSPDRYWSGHAWTAEVRA